MAQQKIREITELLEKFAPLSLQADYDNSGLILGDLDRECKGVLITLDTTLSTIYEAEEKGANLIIEHHPTIFTSIKKLDFSSPKYKVIEECVKRGITIYASHTCFDAAGGGLNDEFLKRLGAEDVHRLSEDRFSPRAGFLKEPITLKEFVSLSKKVLKDENIYFSGSEDTIIRKIAAINGAGGGDEESIILSSLSKADLFISSEFKYHIIKLAKEMNYAIMGCGHYNSEIFFIDIVADYLIKNGVGLVHKSEKCSNPLSRQE